MQHFPMPLQIEDGQMVSVVVIQFSVCLCPGKYKPMLVFGQTVFARNRAHVDLDSSKPYPVDGSGQGLTQATRTPQPSSAAAQVHGILDLYETGRVG